MTTKAVVKLDSPTMINEGQTYPIRLNVTNKSTKIGTPIEAILTIGIAAGNQLIVLITAQERSEIFAPNETRSFEYTMNVPAGSGGQEALITAWVDTPAGVEIASGYKDVFISIPEEVLEVTIPYKGSVEILEINGKKLKNIGNYQVLYGSGTPRGTIEGYEPYPVVNLLYHTLFGAELESPFSPEGIIRIKFRNINIDLRPGVVGFAKAVGFEPKAMGTGGIEQTARVHDCYVDPMYYWVVCQQTPCGDGRQYKEAQSAPGIGSESTVSCLLDLGGFCPGGMYDLVIKVGTVPWDMPWMYGNITTFVIKNAIETIP